MRKITFPRSQYRPGLVIGCHTAHTTFSRKRFAQLGGPTEREKIVMQIRGFKLFAGIVVLMFVAGGVAHAGTQKFTSTSSGTTVDIPIDPDSDSCFAAPSGAVVCTDYSAYFNFSQKRSPGGNFTSQSVFEFDPVSGTSCNIGGTVVPGIASCTLAGSSEQGCKLQAVGGAQVDRDNSTGDLLFSTLVATVCIDLSSGPPFNITASGTETITGGTGKNAGATGTSTATTHGQVLTSDAAGHGIGWFEGSSSGTITRP
jgi:hypothetical protein